MHVGRPGCLAYAVLIALGGTHYSALVLLVLQQTFACEGLQYSMGGLTGNTRNSHRLLAWAAAEHGLDKQNQLAEALFNGYFCKVCVVAPGWNRFGVLDLAALQTAVLSAGFICIHWLLQGDSSHVHNLDLQICMQGPTSYMQNLHPFGCHYHVRPAKACPDGVHGQGCTSVGILSILTVLPGACTYITHTQEQYINDKSFLLSCADSVGLPRDSAAAVLDNPAGKGEQLVQQELGKYAGISGVPHFIINGR
jgi:2-hydroxychromene-2-carboxylate isomerase